VKVKERDLPSLFGGVGLPLSKNGARARVEIRPAISGTRFLPLAVPNTIITKVQVRYYKECGAGAPSQIGPPHDLAPLPSGDQSAFAIAGGGMLWALPSDADPTVGDKSKAFDLAMPGYDPACGDYVPVGVEVRVASRDNVNLDQSCQTLRDDVRYADCYHRLSQIRVWNDGNADNQPRIPRVSLSGGCGGLGDPYFSSLPPGSAGCKYDVTVEVNWGTRDDDDKKVAANFTVTANNQTLGLVSWDADKTAIYASSGGAFTANPGANPVTVSLSWTDTDKDHSWQGNSCKTGNQNPCKYSSGDMTQHQAFVGTSSTAGVVSLVRTSQSQLVTGIPGAPFDNHRSGGSGFDCNSSDTCSVYPTIGTVGVLRTGVLTTLRLDDSQAENQSVFCDPDETQAFPVFLNGCKPWFGANEWKSPWWIDGTNGEKTCPDPKDWYSYQDKNAGFGVNSSGNYWECVLSAPGVKVGQVGDDIAVATENCDDIQNNACQVNSFDCNYDGNYDGKPGNSDGWVQQGGDARYPRVVNLFIVPYQAAKGLKGNGNPIPILGFASFYVMNWTGANAKQSDPCPDTTWDNDGKPATPQLPVPAPPAGAITGIFVESVDYEPGPVDPNATCVEGQLTPCRAVLVR
jgi:hypothetical protein